MLSRRALLIYLPAATLAGGHAIRAFAADKTITIGINLPLTGADAHDAELIKDGALLAIDAGRLRSAAQVAGIEGAVQDRRRHGQQQTGSHQTPHDKHDRPLMRDQRPYNGPATIPNAHLETEHQQHHQRHGGEGEASTQDEQYDQNRDLEGRIMREQPESIEEVAAPADQQQAGEKPGGDQGMSAQAQHRAAARPLGLRSCPTAARSIASTL